MGSSGRNLRADSGWEERTRRKGGSDIPPEVHCQGTTA